MWNIETTIYIYNVAKDSTPKKSSMICFGQKDYLESL